jgi:hypothetical protein
MNPSVQEVTAQRMGSLAGPTYTVPCRTPKFSPV